MYLTADYIISYFIIILISVLTKYYCGDEKSKSVQLLTVSPVAL